MRRQSILRSDLRPLALLLVLFVSGCGKIGDPLPPFIRVPESTSDLTVDQVGYELRFAWTNPLRNVDQSDSTDLEQVVIRAEDDTVAEIVVSGAGERQTLTLSARDLVGVTRQYAVYFETTGGRVSEPSNVVALRVVEVPGPGSAVRATVDQDRILLEWDPPPSGAEVTDAYRIYRSGQVLDDRPITQTRFEDTAYRDGEEYVYTVVPVRRTATGWVEGLASRPLEVTALDRTPPEAPTGVSLTPFEMGAFVRWNSNPENDVIRYRVFRRDGTDGQFRPVEAEPQTTTAYQDSDYQPGYEYAVTALDRSGNESAMSALPDGF